MSEAASGEECSHFRQVPRIAGCQAQFDVIHLREERMLGRKTAEAEVLKDALELVHSKKLPWRGGSSNNGGTR